MMIRTHVVYRFFAADGELLWIGQTKDLDQRTSLHRLRSHWWPSVTETTTTRPTTRLAARRYERMAIRAEQPTHNRQHKSDFHGTPTGYYARCCRCAECTAASRAYLSAWRFARKYGAAS